MNSFYERVICDFREHSRTAIEPLHGDLCHVAISFACIGSADGDTVELILVAFPQCYRGSYAEGEENHDRR